MSTLVTGFDPFADLARNTSEEVVRLVERRRLPGVRTAVLPTVYDVAGERVVRLIEAHSPRLVLMLGMGREADGLRLERLALNLDDCPLPDNAGVRRGGTRIRADGPVGHWARLPLEALARMLASRGLSPTLSRDAGGFLCNHAFYQALDFLERRSLDAACGFVHLQRIAEGSPEPDIGSLADAIEHCIEFLRE